MKSPLEEIFNSFNNLKKELNEQNKENVKKKNLEKVNNFIKKKILNENETKQKNLEKVQNFIKMKRNNQ
jgi:hypothetical protein